LNHEIAVPTHDLGISFGTDDIELDLRKKSDIYRCSFRMNEQAPNFPGRHLKSQAW
jgi:hypothetical protein